MRRFAVPLLPAPVVQAGLAGNNIYIDRNIWPITPFLDPRLFLYVQSLPYAYKQDKRLFRMYLEARQLPQSIYQPGHNEDFSSYFMAAITPVIMQYLERCMKRSTLAFMQIINKEELWRFVEAMYEKEGEDLGMDVFRLYKIICVEANLQAIGFDGM